MVSKLVRKIIAALTLPSAGAIGLIILNIWYEWFTLIPKQYVPLILILFAIPVVIWIVQKTLKKPSSSTYIASISTPPEKWRISSHGVHWKITGSRGYYSKINPNTIRSQTPPICPKCETELEEEEKYFIWKWNCPNCSFKKYSRMSFRDKSYSITRIAKGMFERGELN